MNRVMSKSSHQGAVQHARYKNRIGGRSFVQSCFEDQTKRCEEYIKRGSTATISRGNALSSRGLLQHARPAGDQLDIIEHSLTLIAHVLLARIHARLIIPE